MAKLTEQQMHFYETFGFLAFPGLLDDCIDEIIDEFESIWKNQGGGHDGTDHDGTQRSCIFPFMDQSERLCALLDDPRIHDIAASILGDDFNYSGSDGNYYAGDTHWHSDGWHTHHGTIKIALYLDPLTRDTGALRVIPGSHRVGEGYADELQTQMLSSEDRWCMHGSELPAVALENQPGNVVCFNQNTKHAAFGGGGRRRMFTINCQQRYPEDRIHELKECIADGARFWIDRSYGETMMRTAGPDRMVHLEQTMANDGHLAELSRKKREEMSEPARG